MRAVSCRIIPTSISPRPSILPVIFQPAIVRIIPATKNSRISTPRRVVCSFQKFILSPKAAGNRTPTAPQQSFHLYFSLSSSACVSKLSSSAQKYKQKSLLWGALQFSESCFSARQVKSRREYPLIFSRDFPQYWRKTASENLSGFVSPLLNLSDRPRSCPWSDSSGHRCKGSAPAA